MNDLNCFNEGALKFPVELSEPFLSNLYEKNAENNFTSIIPFERVCVLWNKIIRGMENYEVFKNKIKNIKILEHFCLNAKGIFGIGHRLNEADIGQIIVRCAPRTLHNGDYDWSNISDSLCAQDIQKAADKLIEITDTHFIFERIGCWKKTFYNDDNWIICSDFLGFISNCSINKFKSEKDLPVECYDDFIDW